MVNIFGTCTKFDIQCSNIFEIYQMAKSTWDTIQYNRIINTKNDLLYVESQINNLPKKLNYFKNHVIILISILLQKKVDRNLEAGKSLFSLSSFNFQKYTISKPKNIIFYLVSNAYLSMVFFSDNCSIFQQKINTCRRIS